MSTREPLFASIVLCVDIENKDKVGLACLQHSSWNNNTRIPRFGQFDLCPRRQTLICPPTFTLPTAGVTGLSSFP